MNTNESQVARIFAATELTKLLADKQGLTAMGNTSQERAKAISEIYKTLATAINNADL